MANDLINPARLPGSHVFRLPTLETKLPVSGTAWGPSLLLQDQSEVEAARSCPVDMNHVAFAHYVQTMLWRMRVTNCELDLCPSWFVETSMERLVRVVSASFQDGRVLDVLTSSLVWSLHKNLSLDTDSPVQPVIALSLTSTLWGRSLNGIPGCIWMT